MNYYHTTHMWRAMHLQIDNKYHLKQSSRSGSITNTYIMQERQIWEAH